MYETIQIIRHPRPRWPFIRPDTIRRSRFASQAEAERAFEAARHELKKRPGSIIQMARLLPEGRRQVLRQKRV